MSFGRCRAAALASFVCIGLALVAQTGETYKARLSPVPADARTRPELAGVGSATAVLTGSKLPVTGTFEGLKSSATTAQLHAGAAAGVRGPAIGELAVTKAAAGTIVGAAELGPQQIEALHKGGVYIQIQSEKAPEGVLWGWLLK